MLPGRFLRFFPLLCFAIGTGAAPAALAFEPLDIDANNSTTTLTDGVLALRYMFGLRGPALVDGVVGGGASRNTAADIESYLSGLTTGARALDIDLNGTVDPLTDGLLVVRYLLGKRGAALTQSAIGAGFQRNSSQIESYLGTLTSSGAPVNYCQPGDKTEVVPWPAGGQVRPATNAFVQQVYTFRLEIPLNPSPFDPSKKGFVRTVEVAGFPNVFRELTVSKNPCDFHAPTGGYMYDTLALPDPGPSFYFTVNHPNDYQLLGAVVNFQPGDVIYVSVRNYYNNNGTETPTCPPPNAPPGTWCDMYFDYRVPN